MTIEEHICSGGIATVPDLRGSKECYSDSVPYESLVITQIPEPGTLVDAGQTIINVLTEDGQGNATVCTHYLNVTADNPAPTLECPEPITTWLLGGGYEVPDYTKVVDVIGGCTVYDELVITQSPEAGSFLTTAGTHAITISVTDKYGHTVVCGSTTITLTDPNPTVTVVTPPPPPTETSSFIYPVNLFAYWPLDDFFFLKDYAGSRDLTNLGSAVSHPPQTILNTTCHPPQPGSPFHRGSAYLNRSNTAGFTRVDDSGIRLLATSWTIRFGLNVIAADAGLAKRLVSKRLNGVGNGYQIYLLGFGGATYGIGAELYGGSLFSRLEVSGVGFPVNTWIHFALTLDHSTKTLKLYKDASLVSTDVDASVTLAGNSEPFVIGEQSVGTSMEIYMDELGIWTDAWSSDRVLDDYHIAHCVN